MNYFIPTSDDIFPLIQEIESDLEFNKKLDTIIELLEKKLEETDLKEGVEDDEFLFQSDNVINTSSTSFDEDFLKEYQESIELRNQEIDSIKSTLFDIKELFFHSLVLALAIAILIIISKVFKRFTY